MSLHLNRFDIEIGKAQRIGPSRVTIHHHESPENPWENWDCMTPMLTYSESTQTYDSGDGIEDFHGERRIRQPGLGDLLPALHEFGVFPDVEMGTRSFTRSYADLDEATLAVASAALVEPRPEALKRVRRRVRRALRKCSDGRLADVARTAPVGLLIWRTDR